MNYQEIRIDTIRDVLLCLYGVYTTVCTRDSFTPVRTNAPGQDVLQSLIYLDEDCRKTPDGKPLSQGKLYFYSNSLGMIWSFLVEGDLAYVLGPAFTDNFSVLDIMDKLDSRYLSRSLRDRMMEFIKNVPIVSSLKMHQYGMMFHCALTGRTLPPEDVQMLNIRRQEPDSRISQESLTNYALEQKLWKAVREGNLNYRQELDSALTNITPGNLSGGKYLRQEKNIAIAQVALTCRAAVEGGLSPEIAFPLSDRYIQKIESCTTASELLELSSGVLDDYIRRVHHTKLQSGISAQILACCHQISMHPEENPDLEQMAKKYGYTPYYFSKKFKQEVGLSLRDYTAQQKIEKAKTLLSQNTMSISDISEYLGFNSQSYFGSVFRKMTGVTPSEYQPGCAPKEETA